MSFFDRFAQMQAAPNRSIEALLQEFQTLRENHLHDLRAMNLEANDFQNTGIHPDFGTVTLEQLLATWVVHDLGHIGRISRVMAKQYQASVEPWEAYLGVEVVGRINFLSFSQSIPTIPIFFPS